MRKNKHALIKVVSTTKFKKFKKHKVRGFNFNKIGTQLRYGHFGLKVLKPVKLTFVKVEAFRNILARKKLLKKKSHQVWIRGVLNIPVSRKPNEVRMGKGKGPVDHWIMLVQPGKILLEISLMPLYQAKKIFKIVRSIIGVPCQLIQSAQPSSKFRFLNI